MAHVQTVIGTGNAGTGNSAGVTGSVVGVGNTVVGYARWRDSTASGTASVTDNKSNTYTVSAIGTSTPGAVDWFIIFRLDNVINGPATITASTSEPAANVTFMQCSFSEYSGVRFDTWTSPPNVINAPGGGTDAITSGNITTTGNGNTIWGATSHNGSNVTSVGTGYTSRATDTFWFTRIEDKTQSTAGSVAATFTNATDGPTLTFGSAAISLTPAKTCGSLALIGVGCWVAARKIEENPIIRRRELILPIGRRLLHDA